MRPPLTSSASSVHCTAVSVDDSFEGAVGFDGIFRLLDKHFTRRRRLHPRRRLESSHRRRRRRVPSLSTTDFNRSIIICIRIRQLFPGHHESAFADRATGRRKWSARVAEDDSRGLDPHRTDASKGVDGSFSQWRASMFPLRRRRHRRARHHQQLEVLASMSRRIDVEGHGRRVGDDEDLDDHAQGE